MARSSRRPGRTLIGFFAGLVVIFGLVALAGSWTPTLGLDLQAQLESVGLALHRATFVNDWVDPQAPDHGLFWSIEFKDFAGNSWTIDIRGWDPFDYAVRQARDFSLRTDLAACDRDLILRLKTEARERDNYYGVRVTGWDIYQFAIAKAGDSLSALEMWKAKQ